MLFLLLQLLCINPQERITTVKKLKSVPCISRYNFAMILEKQIKPPFTPPVRLNIDLYILNFEYKYLYVCTLT